ncbi:MAG: GAF domain-containing protein [Chloroflexota bacterium]
MKWPFQKSIKQQDTAAQVETLTGLRERLLRNVLIGSSIVGTLAYFLVVVRSLEATPLAAAIVYTLAILYVIVLTIFQRLPYTLRANSILFLLYLLGLTNYLQSGPSTDGAIFLTTLVVLASIFLGVPGLIYSLLISVISVSLVGFLEATGRVIPPFVFAPDDPSAWINRVVILLFLGIVVGLSLTTIVNGLQRNLLKATGMAQFQQLEQSTMSKHAQDLERRSAQIRTAAEISRNISAVLDPDVLLQRVVDLIKEGFGLYYVGVFLGDEEKRYAILNAGTDEPGKEMVSAGHKLAIADSSMIGWTISHQRPRIALDVGQDAVRFANPLLPLTRSELALPLMTGGKVLGALTIQSEQAEAFDEDDIRILQNIADTLAISIDNSRLFAELQENLQEIRNLHTKYLRQAWAQSASSKHEVEYVHSTRGKELASTMLEIPLVLRDQTIGQLRLEGSESVSPDELILVEAIATQAAIALENARLLEESQQLALRERLVAEITGKIWSSPNTDIILQTSVRELGRALRADEATIELKMD